MDFTKIQLSWVIQQEERQMLLRQQVHWWGRQEQRLLGIPGAEGLAHGPIFQAYPLKLLDFGQI